MAAIAPMRKPTQNEELRNPSVKVGVKKRSVGSALAGVFKSRTSGIRRLISSMPEEVYRVPPNKRQDDETDDETGLTNTIFRRAFAMYDVDGDGEISEWEFHRLVSGIGKRITVAQLDAVVAESSSHGIQKAVTAIKTMLANSQSEGEKGLEEDDGKGESFSFEEFRQIMECIKRLTAEGDVVIDRSNEPWCIFDHDSTICVIWDVFILLVLIYVLMTAPYRIGFDDPAIGGAFYFEICLDFCFITDILVQFRTTFLDDKGRKEFRWWLIGIRYLGGFFLVDLVSSIPWDLVLPNNGSSGDSSSRFLKTLRLVKLTKLGRMAKVQKFLHNIKDHISLNPEVFQVYTALALLLLTSHFLACLWSFAGRYGTHDDLFASDSWQARYGVITAQTATGKNNEYQIALYWAVTTMTTVGFGDIIPGTSMEMAVTTVAMVIGVSFYGYLTAVLTAWFLASDPQQEAVDNNMKVLNSYLTKNHYPRALLRQIKAYFLYFYNNSSAFDEVLMMKQLPYSLHVSTATFLVKKMLRQYTIFSGVDSTLLSKMLKMLKPQSTLAQEIFVRAGDPATTMFMIQKGIVNIIKGTGETDVIGQFSRGQSFMEYAAFEIVEKHVYSALAVSSCALYGIRAEDIMDLGGSYADASIVGQKKPAAVAMATIRQNVLLLEQFRACSNCSQIGLDPEDADFEEIVINLVLGKRLEGKKESLEPVATVGNKVNELDNVMKAAKRFQEAMIHRKSMTSTGPSAYSLKALGDDGKGPPSREASKRNLPALSTNIQGAEIESPLSSPKGRLLGGNKPLSPVWAEPQPQRFRNAPRRDAPQKPSVTNISPSNQNMTNSTDIQSLQQDIRQFMKTIEARFDRLEHQSSLKR